MKSFVLTRVFAFMNFNDIQGFIKKIETLFKKYKIRMNLIVFVVWQFIFNIGLHINGN